LKQQVIDRNRIIADQDIYIRELEDDVLLLLNENRMLRQMHAGVVIAADVVTATVRAVATSARRVSDSVQSAVGEAQRAVAAVTNTVQNIVRAVQGIADGTAATGLQAGFERFVGREAIAHCCRRASRRTSRCKSIAC
jgi:hypothetical protein